MGHGLTGKAGVEAAPETGGAHDQVAHQHGHEDGHKAHEQVEVLQHHGIPDAAGHAQTAALGDGAHHQTGDESGGDGGPHGAGALGGEEDEGGSGDHQDQQTHIDGGHEHAFDLGLGPGLLEGEALLQEQSAHKNADDEADEAQDGVSVTAAQADDHPQGAAQEHEGAHHHAEAQHEPGDGGGATPHFELLARQGHDHGAQHQTDDLGADVLNNGGPVHPHAAGDVTQEAGDTEAHVHRVAQGNQHHRGDAYHQTGQNDRQVLLELCHTQHLTKIFRKAKISFSEVIIVPDGENLKYEFSINQMKDIEKIYKDSYTVGQNKKQARRQGGTPALGWVMV